MFRIVAVRRTISAVQPTTGKLRTGSEKIHNHNHQHRHRNLHLAHQGLRTKIDTQNPGSSSNTRKFKMEKDELRKKLTEDEFRVTQEAATERAFTGKYWNHKDDGIYTCVVCNQPLFSSTTKYDSGSGWPSFYDALRSAESGGQVNVSRRVDESHGMRRIEVICKNCNAHLGHEFDDGPQPTGTRYCINSSALCFQAKKK